MVTVPIVLERGVRIMASRIIDKFIVVDYVVNCHCGLNNQRIYLYSVFRVFQVSHQTNESKGFSGKISGAISRGN